jgi:3-isopropylmalate dehydratase small subunit
LDNVDEGVLDINPHQVLLDIKKGRGEWETQVPESIAEMIINNRLFGFGSSR